MIAGLVVVFVVAHPATTSISYLWYNVIGAVVVTVVGLGVSLFTGGAGLQPGARAPQEAGPSGPA